MHIPALDFRHPGAREDSTLSGSNIDQTPSKVSQASGRPAQPLRMKPQSSVTERRQSTNWHRQEMLSLLSTSGTLAGLCITVVALMNTFDRARAAVTIVDDMFGVCAFAFLLCIYLIFWAIRSRKTSNSEVLIKAVEGVFLLAMTIMTIAAFLMIYTIW